MRCSELLIRDHEIISRSLDVLEGMVRRMEEGKRIEIADIESILKFLQVFADDYHQTLEEHVLFPALLRASTPDSPVHNMILEHGEERTAVAGIANALKAKVGKKFVQNARRLSVVLRSHFSREDAVVPELVGQLLSEAEDNAIVAEFDKRRPSSPLPDFRYLERKYVAAAPRREWLGVEATTYS